MLGSDSKSAPYEDAMKLIFRRYLDPKTLRSLYLRNPCSLYFYTLSQFVESPRLELIELKINIHFVINLVSFTQFHFIKVTSHIVFHFKIQIKEIHLSQY